MLTGYRKEKKTDGNNRSHNEKTWYKWLAEHELGRKVGEKLLLFLVIDSHEEPWKYKKRLCIYIKQIKNEIIGREIFTKL